MLSVIIATLDCERALVPTLATLVAGAAAGTVRDVIVADGGSRDGTRDVADIAGCEIMLSRGSLAARLREATAKARASWVMYLRPGVVLDATWVEEVGRFVQGAEAQGAIDAPAAVFRRMSQPSVGRSPVGDAILQLWSALRTRPMPEQGLVISKFLYERMGRHRDVPDPEADLIARLGRRRILRLGSGIWAPQDT